MPATTAVGPDVAQPETANSLSRRHHRWATELGREIAESQPGWKTNAARNPLLSDDVGDAVLAALSHAIRRYDPADGEFRETTAPMIRRAVVETIAGLRPFTGYPPEIIPQTRTKDRPTMQTAHATNGHANGHAVNRLADMTTPKSAPGAEVADTAPPLTSADLTPRDRDSLKRIAFTKPGKLSAGEVADEWAKQSGRRFDSRTVRFMAKANGMPLAPAEVRDRDKRPKHVPRASGTPEGKRNA